ncbi:MAG TPA: ATP-binding protein [Gammaproteobacteria bacterium]|nr:ATP-binding protein [Gammaproteobacteria bacterium]
MTTADPVPGSGNDSSARFPGDSEMHARVREYDWTRTSLGAVEQWPQSLKTAVVTCLDAGFAHFIWWGPDLIQLYNDAAVAILRDRHPAALGQPARECWREIWDDLAAPVDRVLATAATRRCGNAPLFLDRGGMRQPGYFDLCFSALRDESGNVVGVVIAAVDTTDRVCAEMALRESQARLTADLAGMRRLYELHARLAEQTDLHTALEEIVSASNEFMETDRGCMQLVSADGERLEMFAYRGYADDDPFIRRFLHDGSKGACDAVRRERRRLIIEDIATFPGFDSTPVDREVALAENIRATQSTPLLSRQGEVLGVLSNQFRSPHRPTENQIKLIDMLAWTASEFIARHYADAALRAGEARLRAATNAAQIGVWEFDLRNRKLLYASRRYAQIMGYDEIPDDWTLERALEHFEPADRDRLLDYLRDRGGQGMLESRITRIDGKERWISLGSEVYREGNGTPVRVVGTMLDITERKLREEREQFLLKLSDELRPLGDPEVIQEVAARATAEHLHVSRALYAEVEHEEDGDYFAVRRDYHTPAIGAIAERLRPTDFGRALFESCRRGKPIFVNNVETEPQLTDAERNACLGIKMRARAVVPLVKNGRFIAAFGVHHNAPRIWTEDEITLIREAAERTWSAVKRAAAEAALRESEAQLQQASRAKDEFLAMLGHELRNPLQPIRTTLRLMQMREPNALVDERAIIDSQVQHMIGMVDDLLDVSRIARGKIELKTTALDIGDVILRAIETARPMLEESSQVVETAIGDGLIVEGERRRLVQIMTNLLTNAAKYSPRGRRIHVSAGAERGRVVIRVRDQGIGIAPELLPHIFDSFTQDSQSIERSQGGLGLGLAIVHSLVTLHGGTVEATSAGRDQGSEFIVRLPLVERRAVEREPVHTEIMAAPPESMVAREHLKVLIVDDYASAAESLAELLNYEGFETRIASDGAEAVEAATEFRPEVALIDIGLPVMDGYEVARRLHEIPSLRDTRLIAVTGYGQESDRQRTKEAGFDRHVVKPIDPSGIGALVRQTASPAAPRPLASDLSEFRH